MAVKGLRFTQSIIVAAYFVLSAVINYTVSSFGIILRIQKVNTALASARGRWQSCTFNCCQHGSVYFRDVNQTETAFFTLLLPCFLPGDHNKNVWLTSVFALPAWPIKRLYFRWFCLSNFWRQCRPECLFLRVDCTCPCLSNMSPWNCWIYLQTVWNALRSQVTRCLIRIQIFSPLISLHLSSARRPF